MKTNPALELKLAQQQLEAFRGGFKLMGRGLLGTADALLRNAADALALAEATEAQHVADLSRAVAAAFAAATFAEMPAAGGVQ